MGPASSRGEGIDSGCATDVADADVEACCFRRDCSPSSSFIYKMIPHVLEVRCLNLAARNTNRMVSALPGISFNVILLESRYDCVTADLASFLMAILALMVSVFTDIVTPRWFIYQATTSVGVPHQASFKKHRVSIRLYDTPKHPKAMFRLWHGRYTHRDKYLGEHGTTIFKRPSMRR